jgi:uncharacterized membrane protein YkvA (DUF1232 family)
MTLVVSIGVGFALGYLALVAALLVARPKGNLLAEAMRLLPDLLRLLRRLAADANVPRAARVRLGLLLGYLAIPFDLVPDFVPVLGYVDDAIIVSLVLRSVVSRAGAPLVRRHWPGTDDGLAALARLTGMPLSHTQAPVQADLAERR